MREKSLGEAVFGRHLGGMWFQNFWQMEASYSALSSEGSRLN